MRPYYSLLCSAGNRALFFVNYPQAIGRLGRGGLSVRFSPSTV